MLGCAPFSGSTMASPTRSTQGQLEIAQGIGILHWSRSGA
jgi:hypothetical protein